MAKEVLEMNPILVEVEGETLSLNVNVSRDFCVDSGASIVLRSRYGGYNYSSFFLVLHGWPYYSAEYGRFTADGIYVEIQPGLVDFISSRDSLDFTPRTKGFIKQIGSALTQEWFLSSIVNLSKEMQRAILNRILLSHSSAHLHVKTIKDYFPTVYEECSNSTEVLGVMVSRSMDSRRTSYFSRMGDAFRHISKKTDFDFEFSEERVNVDMALLGLYNKKVVVVGGIDSTPILRKTLSFMGRSDLRLGRDLPVVFTEKSKEEFEGQFKSSVVEHYDFMTYDAFIGLTKPIATPKSRASGASPNLFASGVIMSDEERFSYGIKFTSTKEEEEKYDIVLITNRYYPNSRSMAAYVNQASNILNQDVDGQSCLVIYVPSDLHYKTAHKRLSELSEKYKESSVFYVVESENYKLLREWSDKSISSRETANILLKKVGSDRLLIYAFLSHYYHRLENIEKFQFVFSFFDSLSQLTIDREDYNLYKRYEGGFLSLYSELRKPAREWTKEDRFYLLDRLFGNFDLYHSLIEFAGTKEDQKNVAKYIERMILAKK